MAHITLEDASLHFKVKKHRRSTIKDYFLRHMFRPSANPTLEVKALTGINLDLRDGDRLGVIGHNGAGKSTLLRLLAGIYPPTHGRRDVAGKICSLFDISLGFEGEASGWDNIAYRGYLQGETPTTLKSKIKDIAEFTELGDFLNMSVRYYSAGMLIRLAFSVATAIAPEVLLIDEVLAVGDLAFQVKARQRMQEMMASARLMVMVSHDLSSIENIANKCIWLEHGQIVQSGTPAEVVAAYRRRYTPGAAAAA